MLTFYGYWRSSASYRVRIALNLKGLPCEHRPVHLVRNEQHSAQFLARNPHALVPVLETDGRCLTQSLAIMEFLEEVYPERPLLPADPFDRAWVRAVAQAVACEIHPVNNLRVLKYLTEELGVADAARLGWYRHWIALGFTGLEAQLEALPGDFSLGDKPGLLEACLVPQVYNARRFECDLEAYPRLTALDARCRSHEAFRAAAPEAQPDAPDSESR